MPESRGDARSDDQVEDAERVVAHCPSMAGAAGQPSGVAQAEGTCVEVAGGRDIAHREHHVVDPVELHAEGYACCLTKASAVSATSFHPWSMVSECPRLGSSLISVIAAFLCCRW